MPSEQNEDAPREGQGPATPPAAEQHQPGQAAAQPPDEGQQAAVPPGAGEQAAAAGQQTAAHQEPGLAGPPPGGGSGVVPPAAPPPPASEPGRARRWAGRKPVQLVAAGLLGVVVGGAAVAAIGAFSGHDDRVRVVRFEPRGEGPQGWDGPRWSHRGPMMCVQPGPGQGQPGPGQGQQNNGAPDQNGGRSGPMMCMQQPGAGGGQDEN